MRRIQSPIGLLLSLLALGASGCAKKVEVVKGSCSTVYGGEVCTWGRMSGGELVAFGATIPLSTVSGVPKNQPMTWPPVADATISFPVEVQRATGFSNLTVYGEAMGHPPRPFLTPHFDFHFYTASMADIAAMSCADSSKPANMPVGYKLYDEEIPGVGVLIGTCVPNMGMHAFNAPEFEDTATFARTMIVGYYHGKPIFVEPMVSVASLLEKRDFSLAIPHVPDQPPNARYPRSFQATFDSAAASYHFIFTDFGGASAQSRGTTTLPASLASASGRPWRRKVGGTQ
ncbi:MAG TPA: hypothetical protein VEI06_07975 [Gemmatimonadaceae bacterium]|nr:hypothetical protein [Gemmatimonadaceae bacterium]